MQTKHNTYLNINMKRILLLFVVAFTSIVFCNARDRFYIKNCIDKWETCRNVAITDKGGDIAFVGTNKCAMTAFPPIWPSRSTI